MTMLLHADDPSVQRLARLALRRHDALRRVQDAGIPLLVDHPLANEALETYSELLTATMQLGRAGFDVQELSGVTGIPADTLETLLEP